ncbi:hypothetical protein EVAR_76621_1 [Eumeta japonica]|uniref:Uncharacterized protein n=1 Tax=Eumeta variegata TaxID=151549 RepID=A0A4C1T628_EUMVA|nr:hypothetical protein EVAR_76621_1 [Eumeta japonica]
MGSDFVQNCSKYETKFVSSRSKPRRAKTSLAELSFDSPKSHSVAPVHGGGVCAARVGEEMRVSEVWYWRGRRVTRYPPPAARGSLLHGARVKRIGLRYRRRAARRLQMKNESRAGLFTLAIRIVTKKYWLLHRLTVKIIVDSKYRVKKRAVDGEGLESSHCDVRHAPRAAVGGKVITRAVGDTPKIEQQTIRRATADAAERVCSPSAPDAGRAGRLPGGLCAFTAPRRRCRSESGSKQFYKYVTAAWISDGYTVLTCLLSLGLLEVTFKTAGSWGSEVKYLSIQAFISDLSRILRDKEGDPRSGSYMFQTLSVAIQRGNAANDRLHISNRLAGKSSPLDTTVAVELLPSSLLELTCHPVLCLFTAGRQLAGDRANFEHSF